MTKKIQVLAVDDDQALLPIIAGRLGPCPDIELRCASSGHEALKNCAESMPDVVLMDAVMPTMDGFETTRRILEKDHNCQVLMISSRVKTEADIRKGIAAGVSGFINKPFEYPELTLNIRIFAEKRKRQIQEEQNLLESRGQYLNLIADINDVIFSVDSRGVFTFVSPVITDLTGFESSEITGKKFSDFIHPEDQAFVTERFVELRSTGAIKTTEYRIRKKNGEWLWVRSSSKPRYSNKEFDGIRGVITDISENKNANEALRESEQRFKLLVDNASIAIARINLDKRFVFANKFFCGLMGLERDRVIGRELSFLKSLVRPRDYQNLRHEIATVLKKNTQTHLEIPYTIGSSQIWLDHAIYAWYTLTGKKGGVELICSDITAKKNTHAVLEHKHHALRELIEQIEFEKQQIKNQVADNAQKLLKPVIAKLRKSAKTIEKEHLDVLEQGLDDLTAAFSKKLLDRNTGLTSREIEICNLIKQDCTTKKIAELLNLSVKTVNTHRNNIRKKMGIRNKKTSLSIYLKTI